MRAKKVLRLIRALNSMQRISIGPYQRNPMMYRRLLAIEVKEYPMTQQGAIIGLPFWGNSV